MCLDRVTNIEFRCGQGCPVEPKCGACVFRDELFNEPLFTSLAQARAVLTAWKDDYNNARPRGALGNLTPTEYANRSVPGPQRGGTLRYAEGSAPRPVAPPSPMGSNATRTLPIAG